MRAAADHLTPSIEPPAPRSRLHWLTAAGVVLAAGTLALGILVLIDLRSDAWTQAEKASGNLAAALEQDITRNLEIIDLSIQRAAEALALPGIDAATPEVRRAALFDRAAAAKHLDVISVIDANGTVVESSAGSLSRFNYADRDYVQVHRQQPELGLFISRPFQSKTTGKWVIALSRSLPTAGGEFAGVVVGTVRLDVFSSMFGRLDLGPNGTVSLFREDGRVIVRSPFLESDVDRDLGAAPTFGDCVRIGAGNFVAEAAVDHVKRLYTCRRFRRLPLVLSVNVSTDSILAPWRSKAAAVGSTLATLCLATVALSLLFRRELRRRQRVERALRASAERLSTLASTDAMTGLANRRVFEDALQREWRRAVRNELPIALLLFDADFFKTFNDQYGHPAGDQALQAIAACMRRGIRRPCDLAARYGGEEFVILLPETDDAGVVAVAERIRAAIESLAIPHLGNPAGCMTVSVGAVSNRPGPADDVRHFVAAADKALYAAKAAGRNRTGLAGDRPPAPSHAPSASKPLNIGLRLIEGNR